ncbi:ankyrin repeat domain-containing protein 12 isoform X1 [Triplophysa rosa]|uniref:Ankyrin repeat domain-containing protein 12 n=1 Tax=Triplophysa rosa TaxID=992332 RepID=A0A9W8C809_TRIRA|nr:ankyrin repeat domain-containing protein 12 isoform X1 [Triplophysa rosa]XP_057189118.1 ankyrin repeat domain-containing protein 12 isoform X1 [Triplophysa rosa]XP_057189119.1 ankyrin repeat domain-containing protein 12 isoform X1 [Triplophysa rosa]KAI7809789.1 putative ankyrin repeat domain-containing protein 12 [Triplophysa rosa]
MAKPGSDRDGAMVEKTAGKKSKEKISPFTKTPKLDRSEIMGKDGKSKSSMKRKLSFTVSPQRNEERDSDTDDSDPGQSSDAWGERLLPPCRIYADKDGPDKKKVKKESCGKKSTPVNILFGYPLSERKQMALLMQMTARDNSPDTTPSHPSQSPAVQKKIPSSSSTRQKDKVNKRNERGETALHMAAIRGDVKQVKELIGLGADVNVKDFAGWTPLHEACNLGYYDVAKVLIGAGAEVNTQGLDDDTPLHDASSSGHKDIVKLLLRHGGNAFQLNKRGERPVDVADSQELEQLLKGEIPLSDPEESSSESEDPPSVNPSSVDENMEYSDAEKDSDSKSTTVKASSSMSGLDEYEFKDEEEEEDLSKALNDRHILRRELRQKEKEEKEGNHYASKQGSKSEQLASKSKKMKASRVYCSSDSSSDEAEVPPERRSSPTRSVSVDGHKTDGRSKKESLNLTPVEQKEKCKQKKKNKSQNKNKENQEVREEGKENSKSLLFTTATVSDNSDKGVREEDSFKMSFSAKDDTSVHLFHLSVVKSPKLNHSQTDKQTTPLKQENTKTCVSIGDGPCPADSVKYNHYTESDFCTEGSSSKSCKHKEKSKHHHKELGLDGDDGSSSPFKDSSLSNSMDSSEGAFRKTDKDGKVVKKHKLNHKEKEKYRKEYEAERNRHRQKEPRKDGHRNMEFDREFWKENFFKSDENEELGGKCEMLGGESPLKSLESSPAKEERGASKDKHSSSSSSKDRRPKEEREKDKGIKKEKKEMPLKDERGREGKGDELDDRTEGLGSGRMHEGSQHSSGVKEETDDKPITGNSADQDPLGSAEKNTREKNDKRQPTKDREAEKSDKKLADKDKKVKSEHLAEKPELHNSTDRWKEKEKLTSSSHSPNDKNHKESEKLKAVSAMKKHEENKKNKDKRSEKEHSSSDHRDKDKTSSEKKVKAPEKTTDNGKSDRTKDKEGEKDSDKRKKEKSKETNPSSSSYSNLKLLLEEKKGYICENNKVISSKSKEEVTKSIEKDKERRERDRESERHRERDRHKEKDKDRSQLNKDGKLSKTKPNEAEFKSKGAPTLKDTHRKEKRLVNDDLMKTSFERMLSLKDQEIEQWHKKHLEKIKQKERERLKQRPGVDLGKQKSKEKTNTKTSSSSSEPCLNKELTRSKSSDVSDGHREKILKDATGGRTVSLDAKNLSTLGKNGPVIENSRSPRPESERSGLMSRSVSMISVASSEDSCQTTMLTPRLTEDESDLNMEASDSQPPCLQASLILQSSRSPMVHDKDTSGLPDTASCNRTPLLIRHASPCLRAILDEEAKAPPAETRPNEESQRIGVVSQPSNEQTAVHSAEISAAPVQETYSTLPNGESNEGEEVTPACQGQPSSCLHESSVKDLGSQPANLTQANNVVQTHTEQNRSGTHVDQSDVPGITIPEGSNKDPLLDVVSTPASFQPSQTQISSDNSAPVHSGSQQMETVLNSRSEQSLREDISLKQEQNVVAENKTDKSGESVIPADWTSTPSTSVDSCRSEETAKALLQEDLKKDTSKQEEATSRLSTEPLSTVDALPEKHEQDAASVTNCTSQERLPVEPMESSEEASDKNRIPETNGAMVLSSEGETTQALTERSDQIAVEEKPAQSDIPASGEQSDNSTDVQHDSQAETSSEGSSGSSSPLSVTERDSDTGARAKVQDLDEEADMQVTHPRKRKISRVPATAQSDLTTQQVREKTQQSLAAIVDSLKLEEIQPYQTERANPYYEYLHIRKKIEEKRKVLCSVIPQAPQYYDEYVTFNGSYLLDGNPLSKLCIPTITPPPSLPEPLKEMFKQQEVVRMKLRLQHSIEREKLIVSNEQEVLRVHYRAARTLANQTLPFSACTVLLDAEVYNMPQDVQGDDGKTSVRDRFNARQFMSWLQDVDDKFDKLKTCLLMRQQHEAAALNAVQRLEWQLKLQELDPATYKSTSIFEIPEFYIPLVEVNDDFDLTPI